MGLEQNEMQQYRECPDKFVSPGTDYQMTTRDYVVRPIAHANGPASIYITLPPVAEARGRFYSIIARDASNAHNIIIRDKDDSECWIADITLNSKCDRVLAYSDGLAWLIVYLGGWPQVSSTFPPGTDLCTTLTPSTEIP